MGNVEGVLPISVVSKLMQVWEQCDHAAVAVLEPATEPTIEFVHSRKPEWAHIGSSLAVFCELTELDEVQIVQLLRETSSAIVQVRTSKCEISAEQVSVADSRYTVLAISECNVSESADEEQKEHSHSQIFSAATASWTSSLVHAMCQPTHVTQNVADLIEMQFDAGVITGDPLPRYLEMLRLATAQATEQLEAVKLQFSEYSDMPERMDLAEAVRETFGLENSRLASGDLPIHVTCDAVRFRLLLSSLHAVASGWQSAAGANVGDTPLSVSVDTCETAHRLRVRFAHGVPYHADVLKTNGDEILPSSILQVCASIAEGCLAEFSLLSHTQSQPTSHGETLEPMVDSAALVQVDGVDVVFPVTYQPPEYRMARSVRYVW